MFRLPLTLLFVLILNLVAAGQTRPAAAALSGPPPATRPADSWRVVTFNIRNADADDDDDAWPKRRVTFLAAVWVLDPDVLGMQEVLARQQDDLVATLSDYGSVSAGRDDGKRRGEASPIFFRRSRLTLVDHGTFWLSETPETVGSVGWDAALTRICTWAVLRDTAGRELLAANTHFDHRGVAARTHSAELIRDRLATLAAGRPVVLTGDFNSDDDTDAYAAFVPTGTGPSTQPASPWVDAFRAIHPERSNREKTYHGFQGGTQGMRIDYVFCSPELSPLASGIDRRRGADGRWPSDHYAVWADLRWPEGLKADDRRK